jgi:hypothetical protein
MGHTADDDICLSCHMDGACSFVAWMIVLHHLLPAVIAEIFPRHFNVDAITLGVFNAGD